MTSQIAIQREELSAFWHKKMNIWMQLPNFGFATQDRYQAFCVAKDQLQDTSEALLHHRRVGFGNPVTTCYLELWGILQAVAIQQDAIKEMRYALTGNREIKRLGPAWKKMRDLRNLFAGHPTFNGRSSDAGEIRRSVIARQQMSYTRIRVTILCHSSRSHETLAIGRLLDEYDTEAACLIKAFLDKLKKQIEQAD